MRCLPGPLGFKTLCNACGLRWRGGGKADNECRQCGGNFTTLAVNGSACQHKSAVKAEYRSTASRKRLRLPAHLSQPDNGGQCEEVEFLRI